MHIDEDGAWVKREVNIDAPDDPELRLSVNGQTRWRIYSNGNGGDTLTIGDADESAGVVLAQDSNAWASLSDERAKADWRSFGDALGKVRALDNIGSYARARRRGVTRGAVGRSHRRAVGAGGAGRPPRSCRRGRRRPALAQIYQDARCALRTFSQPHPPLPPDSLT
jgi:hypothetical protein